MVKFGKWVVKYRIPILIISILLLIPSLIGIMSTRINYDMLTYLPEDMDTVIGQNILMEDFGKGGFSLVIVEGMEPKDVSSLKEKFENVEHVDSVVWYDSLADLSVPMEILPEKYYDAFNKGDATMMAVFFDTATSADETMQAVKDMREIAGKNCFISGMSALVTDLKDLCENEEPIYVAIAVVLACLIMMIFMDSWIIPLIFLASIGIAIVVNLGTNFMLGEISYITKALSAVLQLAVTMDYSIFLWHSYSEQKLRFEGDKKRAMAHAVSATITSVTGSSITTIAGFLALCFMSFTLGRDLGTVMAKGVVLGVIGCVTTLPAMILVFDKVIEKTKHKPLLPKFKKLPEFITKRAWIFILIFIIALVPAYYGYNKTDVYYNLADSLPEDMDFMIANSKLQDDFDMATAHMVLVNSDMSAKDAEAMLAEIEHTDGVKAALGMNSLLGSSIPEEIIPDSIRSILKGDRYQLMLVSSEYSVASDEANEQIAEINNIIKKYDEDGMLIGEGPCTKDLIEVTDRDFKIVNIISIAAIFIIIAVVMKSISLPFILVAVIEFAIFINLGIPYYTNVTLPFVAPICISTIQLGATVDYAILMTTRYKRERFNGAGKKDSIKTAVATSIPSIIVSALGFFAATFGVGLYSDVDIIGAICNLMARGAIISMLSVIFILPALLMIFDRIICCTTAGIKPKISWKESINKF